MALHFIVDGYNAIRRTSFLDHEKLRDAREALLRFIDTYRPHGSASNSITVVFDGKNGFLNFQHQYDSSVVFSRGETADAHIIAMVEEAPNAKTLKVVSDDKGLIRSCRLRGAQSLSVAEFMRASCRKMQKKKKNLDGFYELEYTKRKKINEELSKIWLKENK